MSNSINRLIKRLFVKSVDGTSQHSNFVGPTEVGDLSAPNYNTRQTSGGLTGDQSDHSATSGYPRPLGKRGSYDELLGGQAGQNPDVTDGWRRR